MKTATHFIIALFVASALTGCRRLDTTPFDAFVGKDYADYHYALRDTLRTVYATDNEESIMQAVEQMRLLPDIFHDRQWQLEAEYLRLNFYHDYRNGNDDQFISDLLSLRTDAQKAGNRVFALRITRRLMDHYYFGNDPLGAIRYALELEKEQEDITEQKFPDIVDNSYRLASLFSHYGRNDKAQPYLEYILAHKKVPEIELVFMDARNDLAIMLRKTDMERSDSLFLSMTTDTAIADKGLWTGIGLGNYGSNRVIEGKYEEAIPWLLQSYEITRLHNADDWQYHTGLAADLVKSYSNTGKLTEAGHWVDTLKDVNFRAMAQGHDVPATYYSSLSGYEFYNGNPAAANAYKDSCIQAITGIFDKWSPALVSDMEKILVDEEFMAASAKSRNRMITAVSLAASTLILMAILAYLLIVIKRKRQLIDILSLKARQWATAGRGIGDKKPQIDKILEYMESSKAYLRSDCSLESIAKATMLNRSYVSKAINEKYRNFNYMLNSFRIREALRIMDENHGIKVEILREECGFGSTSSFYESFKNITGMTLTEYRSSISKS